jgi:hypothetical protein
LAEAPVLFLLDRLRLVPKNMGVAPTIPSRRCAAIYRYGDSTLKAEDTVRPVLSIILSPV